MTHEEAKELIPLLAVDELEEPLRGQLITFLNATPPAMAQYQALRETFELLSAGLDGQAGEDPIQSKPVLRMTWLRPLLLAAACVAILASVLSIFRTFTMPDRMACSIDTTGGTYMTEEFEAESAVPTSPTPPAPGEPSAVHRNSREYVTTKPSAPKPSKQPARPRAKVPKHIAVDGESQSLGDLISSPVPPPPDIQPSVDPAALNWEASLEQAPAVGGAEAVVLYNGVASINVVQPVAEPAPSDGPVDISQIAAVQAIPAFSIVPDSNTNGVAANGAFHSQLANPADSLDAIALNAPAGSTSRPYLPAVVDGDDVGGADTTWGEASGTIAAGGFVTAIAGATAQASALRGGYNGTAALTATAGIINQTQGGQVPPSSHAVAVSPDYISDPNGVLNRSGMVTASGLGPEEITTVNIPIDSLNIDGAITVTSNRETVARQPDTTEIRSVKIDDSRSSIRGTLSFETGRGESASGFVGGGGISVSKKSAEEYEDYVSLQPTITAAPAPVDVTAAVAPQGLSEAFGRAVSPDLDSDGETVFGNAQGKVPLPTAIELPVSGALFKSGVTQAQGAAGKAADARRFATKQKGSSKNKNVDRVLLQGADAQIETGLTPAPTGPGEVWATAALGETPNPTADTTIVAGTGEGGGGNYINGPVAINGGAIFAGAVSVNAVAPDINHFQDENVIAAKASEDLSEDDEKKLAGLGLKKEALKRDMGVGGNLAEYHWDFADKHSQENNHGLLLALEAHHRPTYVETFEETIHDTQEAKEKPELGAIAEKNRKKERGDMSRNMDNSKKQEEAKELETGQRESKSGAMKEPGHMEHPEDEGMPPDLGELPAELPIQISGLATGLDALGEPIPRSGSEIMDMGSPVSDNLDSASVAGQADGWMVTDNAPAIPSNEAAMPPRVFGSQAKEGQINDEDTAAASSIGAGKGTGKTTDFEKSGRLPLDALNKRKQMMDASSDDWFVNSAKDKQEQLQQGIKGGEKRDIIPSVPGMPIPQTDRQKLQIPVERERMKLKDKDLVKAVPETGTPATGRNLSSSDTSKKQSEGKIDFDDVKLAQSFSTYRVDNVSDPGANSTVTANATAGQQSNESLAFHAPQATLYVDGSADLSYQRQVTNAGPAISVAKPKPGAKGKKSNAEKGSIKDKLTSYFGWDDNDEAAEYSSGNEELSRSSRSEAARQAKYARDAQLVDTKKAFVQTRLAEVPAEHKESNLASKKLKIINRRLMQLEAKRGALRDQSLDVVQRLSIISTILPGDALPADAFAEAAVMETMLFPSMKMEYTPTNWVAVQKQIDRIEAQRKDLPPPNIVAMDAELVSLKNDLTLELSAAKKRIEREYASLEQLKNVVENRLSPSQAPSQLAAVVVTPPMAPVTEDDAPLPAAPSKPAPPVNPFVLTEKDAQSTFALEADTAAYSLSRRYIGKGYNPPPAVVRMEEFINAFDYQYPAQTERTFTVHAEAAPAPFGKDLTLLKIGVRGKVLGRDGRKRAHLVFVVDASGSMARGDRMPLVQHALGLLVDQLNPDDRVTLVTYGSRSRLMMEAMPAAHRAHIGQALNAIECGNATNMLAGIESGYELARRHYKAGDVNRIILCSDGVANLGPTDVDAMLALVEDNRSQGITFTSVGVGAGSYDDGMMEQLANRGDGNYVYIDSPAEARRVFVDNFSATLQNIARDVKIQVEFDPAKVRRYRLVGYENRDIADKDFRNDKVDAGEIGSGQSATALYELELHDTAAAKSADFGTVFVRYKAVDDDEVTEFARRLAPEILRERTPQTDPRFFLAACVAEFAEILRGSEHAGKRDFKAMKQLLIGVANTLPLDNSVQELLKLVENAQGQPVYGQ